MTKKELTILENILWSMHDKNKYKKARGKLIWRHKETDRLCAEKNDEEPFLIFFVQKLPEWFSLFNFVAGKYGYEYIEIFGSGKSNNCFVNYETINNPIKNKQKNTTRRKKSAK